MKAVEEWKALLRARLRAALRAKDKLALAALQETLAAIENAEAPPTKVALASEDSAAAGSVSGLGAGEAAPLVLAPQEVMAIVEREVSERREAAAEYLRLGRPDEARVLSSQADLLAALALEAS